MPPDQSWYWPVLEEYRDSNGRTLEEAENDWIAASDLPVEQVSKMVSTQQWTLSPKPESATRFMMQIIEAFYHPNDEFSYLEFCTCFGTTIATVLKHFENAHGIGLEMNPSRFAVSSWLADRMRNEFHLDNRLSIQQNNLLDADLAPKSIDIVFMDTNHRYPDDYDYVIHLLKSGILSEDFIFIGDDPMHTGTQRAREQLILEFKQQYRFITRPDKNLWWFRPR